MTDRHYYFGLGIVLLACLYYDHITIVAVLVAYLLFEGVTNWRLPLTVAKLTKQCIEPPCRRVVASGYSVRYPMDAERVLRFLIASLLLVSLFVFPGPLWWLAWFIGFSLLGAALNGTCPMLTILRMVGFR